MLKLINFNVVYHHQNDPVFSQPLNYEFARGAVYLFCQNNGSGKTSFFKAIAGIAPKSGRIEKDHKGTLYLDQNFRKRLNPHISMSENLNQITGRNKHLLSLRTDISLTDLDVEKNLIVGQTSSKSEGQKQYVTTLAALSALDASLVLLDEPFAALDMAFSNSVWKKLYQEAKKGKTIFATAHRLIVPDFAESVVKKFEDWKEMMVCSK